MTCDVRMQVVYPHSILEVKVSDGELMQFMNDAQLGYIVDKHGLLQFAATSQDSS